MAPVIITARDDPDNVHFGSLTGTAATTAAIAVFVACFLVSVICVRVAYIIRTRRGAAGVQPWYAAAIRHVPIGRAQADLEAARGVENHELVDMPAANNNRHYPYGPMPNPVQTIPTPMPTQPQPVYSGMPAAGNFDFGNGRVNFDAYHAAFPNGLRGRENARDNQGRGNTGGSPPPPPPYNTDNGNWDVFSDGSLSPLPSRMLTASLASVVVHATIVSALSATPAVPLWDAISSRLLLPAPGASPRDTGVKVPDSVPRAWESGTALPNHLWSWS
ncbi:hypothetical protein QBC33DRAFT_515417 [Phialemonium atrogriseum]|uniref:Uncharacterized protein n=1 Tax=Phialemonium atrogriseum TaxID=1093897 RepID=A0AAJ0BZ94_9PEZI|nr:uncharacterized protein QBC33DRAFT_515417 [Phialemonium atrogriseum]KAK1767258.1 hypothetical protein QBC33DRAFT_515417 [Phialemonium atrogriseum]